MTNYAQGAASLLFKDALRKRIKELQTEDDLESLLNDVHDATLDCKNVGEGLKAATKRLER